MKITQKVSVLVAVTMIGTSFLTSYRVANAQGAEAATSQVVGETSPEWMKDFEVTQEDLGAADATILPDNPLHFFKEVGWTLTEALTFDPVADAELKLEHANQELYEVHLLAQTEGVADAEVAGDLADAAQRIAGRMDDIAGEADSLQLAAAADPSVSQLLTEVVEHQVNQEKVLGAVEEQVKAVAADDAIIDLRGAREDSVAGVAAVLAEAVEEPEAIVELVDGVLDEAGAEGSAFVELKNLEFIEKLEDAVVGATAGAAEEEAVAAMGEVQESAVARFEEDLDALPEEDRAEKLVEYMEFVPGDETHLFSAADSLKEYALPEDVLVKIEEMKDVVATRVAEELEEVDEDVRAAFFERLTVADDFKDVRFLDEITDRVVIDDADIKAEIEQYREEGVKQFTERFTDALSSGQAERFRALSVQMAEKPDPTTMKLMMELEGAVRSDPEKAVFLNEMQGLGQKMRTVFEEKFDRYGDYFMKQTATSDPRDLAIMEQFAKQYQPAANLDLAAEFGDEVFEVKGAARQPFLAFGAPSDADDPFAAFQSEQKSFITQHVQSIDNPDMFRAMQERFVNATPDVMQEMQSFGNFKEVFNQKANFIQDKVLAEEAAQVQAELQQQSAAVLLDQLSGVTDEIARQQILQQAQTQQAADLEMQLKARQNFIKQSSSLNPFCDAACQQASSQRFERKFEQQTAQLKQDVQGDVTKQLEQFKALEQSGGLEQFKAQFEKQGTFPGQGATGGFFPGQGATGGVFPGLGRPGGFEIPAPGEVPDTLTRPVPTPLPVPVVDDGSTRTYPRTEGTHPKTEGTYTRPEGSTSYPKPGETGYHAPTPEEMKAHTGETGTYPKPTETPGSFEDFFKTYQPKPGETTVQPKAGETTTLPGTTLPGTTLPGTTLPGTTLPSTGTTYPKPGEPGYHAPTEADKLHMLPGTTVPSTGTTLPGTTLPGTTLPSTGTTLPTTQPTTQPLTTQPLTTPTVTEPTPTTAPITTQPLTTPTVTEPAPTVTQPAPTVTEPAPTYTAPTYTAPTYTAPTDMHMMPHASVWQRLARGLYAFLTFPARAFGL